MLSSSIKKVINTGGKEKKASLFAHFSKSQHHPTLHILENLSAITRINNYTQVSFKNRILLNASNYECLGIMPRGAKKKHPQNPPPKHPAGSDEMMHWSTSMSMSTLITNERNTMMKRAMTSAKHHGINLKPGSPTPGLGDCAFEAIVNSNNERNCFKEKYPLSISSYRQIWMTDMANRTIDSEWNIYSPQEWLAGWQEMLVPGIYERGISGDLMLPDCMWNQKKFLDL